MRIASGGAIDQVLYSASTMVLILTVARGSSPTEFGRFAVWQAVVLLVSGAGRGLFGQVLSIVYAKAGRVELHDSIRGVRASSAYGFCFLIGLFPAVILIGADAGAVLLIVSIPLVVAQDTSRFAAFANQNIAVPIRSDGAWVVVQLTLYVAALVVGWDGSEVAVGAWAAGAVVALILAVPGGNLRAAVPSGLASWVRSEWGQASRLVGFMVASEAQRLLSVAVLALVLGPVALGGFRGAQTLTAPVQVIAQGSLIAIIPLAVKQHAAGRSVGGLAVGVSSALVTLALLAGIVWALMPSALGTALLGDTWSSASDIVLLVAGMTAAQLAVSGAHVGLAAIGQLGLMMRVRIVAAIAIPGGLLVGGSASGLTAALWWGVVAAIGATLYGWSVWRHASPSETVAAEV